MDTLVRRIRAWRRRADPPVALAIDELRCEKPKPCRLCAQKGTRPRRVARWLFGPPDAEAIAALDFRQRDGDELGNDLIPIVVAFVIAFFILLLAGDLLGWEWVK